MRILDDDEKGRWEEIEERSSEMCMRRQSVYGRGAKLNPVILFYRKRTTV